MLDRSFIVRLFTIDQSLEVPLNVYLTSRTFYERFVKDAVYEINGDVQYLVDSVIDEKDTGVILLEEDKAFTPVRITVSFFLSQYTKVSSLTLIQKSITTSLTLSLMAAKSFLA